MLDKSVPYKNVIMKIAAKNIDRIAEPVLPEGFSFWLFQDGNEKDWARIEASVLEFDSIKSAETYFIRDYMPHRDLLKRRCLFVLNPDGVPVATATAWFAFSILGYQPSLHWVGVCPEYQGLGLGKAVSRKATKLFSETDKGADVFLHTQTWSHKAIRIYHDMGYRLLKAGRIAIMSNDPEGTKIPPNDYSEAIGILESLFDKTTFIDLQKSALD